MSKAKPPPTKPKAEMPLKHYLYDLHDIMAAEVTVIYDGKEITMTRQRAILMRIAADAMSGNSKAVKAVSEFFKIGIPTTKSPQPSSEFKAMMDRMERDIEAKIIELSYPTTK